MKETLDNTHTSIRLCKKYKINQKLIRLITYRRQVEIGYKVWMNGNGVGGIKGK